MGWPPEPSASEKLRSRRRSRRILNSYIPARLEMCVGTWVETITKGDLPIAGFFDMLEKERIIDGGSASGGGGGGKLKLHCKSRQKGIKEERQRSIDWNLLKYWCLWSQLKNDLQSPKPPNWQDLKLINHNCCTCQNILINQNLWPDESKHNREVRWLDESEHLKGCWGLLFVSHTFCPEPVVSWRHSRVV